MNAWPEFSQTIPHDPRSNVVVDYDYDPHRDTFTFKISGELLREGNAWAIGYAIREVAKNHARDSGE